MMRRWLKQGLVSLLGLAALYLLAANLFLGTRLGPWAVNRRPERLRVQWASAWSLWPGAVAVRGLAIAGRSRSVAWSVAVERGRGRIDLPGLLSRRFRVSGFQGAGVRSTVVRPAVASAGPAPGTVGRTQSPGTARRRHPWTVHLDGIALAGVREIGYNDLRLAGSGRAAGAFDLTVGGDFRLAPSTLEMSGGRLLAGGRMVARDLGLAARVRIDPYSPRRHPGVQGFDFVSGSLRARGRLPVRASRQPGGTLPRASGPGALALDLRLERGLLGPGSRVVVSLPPDLALTGQVAATGRPGADRLVLGLQTRGFAAGGRPGGTSAFQSDTLAVTAATSETRLRRLLATARSLRASGAFPSPAPLAGDARASGVRIAVAGSRAACRLTCDRAAGRVDLPALLRREILIDGLRAEGVSGRLTLARRPPPAARATPPRWAVRITDARLAGVREIGLDDFLLAGEARAEGGFSLDRAGRLAVDPAALALADGRFLVGEETAAHGIALEVEARIDPFPRAEAGSDPFLRHVSGTARLRGRVASLGFLHRYFERTPWLSLQGRGSLDADLRIARGWLAPGTRLAVEAAPIEARLLDSLATGRGTVTGAVAGGPGGARTSLEARFRRFGLVGLRRVPGRAGRRAAYLEGRGLRIAVATPALDLAAPVRDVEAVVDLADATVPDLRVYDDLLPAGAGLAILSGRGRVRLHLEASTATGRGRGEATLTSEQARIRFQDLELAGGFALRAPFATADLQGRRFDLSGTRLDLDRLTYREVGREAGSAGGRGTAGASPDWWAHARLAQGSVQWGTPLSLRARGEVTMRNTGPILELFATRRRFLHWFSRILTVEDVVARATVRIAGGELAIHPLEAAGGNLRIDARMRFSGTRRQGDLLVELGRLAAGIELLDGQRTFRLLRPRQWYESREGLWSSR